MTTLDGLRSVDPDARKLMRTLDASRWQIFRRVEAPPRCPRLFSGAKIAVAVAVDRRRVRRVGRLRDGPRPPDAQRATASSQTARAFAAVVVLLAVRDRACSGCWRCSSGASSGGAATDPAMSVIAPRRSLRSSLVAALGLAACGEKPEDDRRERPQRSRSTLMLDFYPNPDHAGIYAAQTRGYFARGRARRPDHARPPIPSAPIKLVAAGRADLAISYEPEVLLARDQGARRRRGRRVRPAAADLADLRSATQAITRPPT